MPRSIRTMSSSSSFVKYVSDKYAGQPDALIEVPEGGSFQDMVALKGDKEIGDKINKIIAKLAEANDLKGVIDVADFNDADKLGKGKEMVDRLSNLVGIFESPGLDFSKTVPKVTTFWATPTNTLCATSPPNRVRAKVNFTPRQKSRASWPRSSALVRPRARTRPSMTRRAGRELFTQRAWNHAKSTQG